MPRRPDYDAVVVGAGPNGLAAAIRLAEAGRRVVIYEANETPGGGLRSMPLTRPGFVHDFGAAVFPLGLGSPYLRRLPLEKYGLEWIHPDLPVAHPLEGGRAALLHRSMDDTAVGLGRDGGRYASLVGPLVRRWSHLADELLQPLLHVPRHPITLARFGLPSVLPPAALGKLLFRDEPAQTLWAGVAAHAARPFSAIGASAFGLLLCTLAHRVGWPVARGGAGAITAALVAHLESLGGEIVTGRRIHDLDGLPPARAILLNVPPREVLRLTGDRLPDSYRRRLEGFQPGPGTFKLDYALDGPIPWENVDVARAGTVHLGASLDEIAASEAAATSGRIPEQPYMLVAQPSLFDPTRAPDGKHTLWAYTHIPNGSTVDMTAVMEDQIERFAPGFRDRIIERHTMGPMELEAMNPNLIGGDVSGGRNDLWQMVARPVLRANPYRTPVRGLYLCSASTPPGGGVHGMCGFNAANTVLADLGINTAEGPGTGSADDAA